MSEVRASLGDLMDLSMGPHEGAPTLIRTPVVAGLGRAGRAVEKEAEQWPLPEITASDAGLALSKITRA